MLKDNAERRARLFWRLRDVFLNVRQIKFEGWLLKFLKICWKKLPLSKWLPVLIFVTSVSPALIPATNFLLLITLQLPGSIVFIRHTSATQRCWFLPRRRYHNSFLRQTILWTCLHIIHLIRAVNYSKWDVIVAELPRVVSRVDVRVTGAAARAVVTGWMCTTGSWTCLLATPKVPAKL